MKRFLLYFLVSVSFLSCRKSDLPSVDSPEPSAAAPYKISVDALKRQALTLGAVFGSPLTKGRVSEVREAVPLNSILFSKGLTKSVAVNPDVPQAYIVNFENEGGFAILVDDQRIGNNVLAYSDCGGIDQTTDNPGVLAYLEDVNAYLGAYPPIDYIIEEAPIGVFADYRTDRSAAPSNWGEASGEACLVWRCPELIDVVVKSPMLHVSWNRGYPYNAMLGDDMMTYDAHVGTIAIAQLMSYYQWPQSVNVDGVDHPIDWNKAISGDIIGSNIPYLIKSVDAGITDDNLPQKLRSHGYQADNFTAFDESTIITDLKNNRPVLSFGVKPPNANGVVAWGAQHHWVIDGYIITSRSTRVTDYLQYINRQVVVVGQRIDDNVDMWQPYNMYYHHNWGWGGLNNGYFMDMGNEWKNYKFDSANKNDEEVKYPNDRKIIINVRP